jgi:hypothetical protein
MADVTTLPRFSIAATSPAKKQLPILPTTRQGLNVIVEAIEHVVGREVAAAVSRDNPQPSPRPAASPEGTRRPDTINAGDVRHTKHLMQNSNSARAASIFSYPYSIIMCPSGHAFPEFILILNTWSYEPGQRNSALP